MSQGNDWCDDERGDPSSDVELERLEPTANRRTAGALPPGPLLRHQDVDARRADAADALGAGERLLQERDGLARGAVDLGVLGGVARRRVREPLALDVEVVAALAALHGGERMRVGQLVVVGGWRKGLLEGRGLVVAGLELGVRKRRQRRSRDGHGRLGHLLGRLG